MKLKTITTLAAAAVFAMVGQSAYADSRSGGHGEDRDRDSEKRTNECGPLLKSISFGGANGFSALKSALVAAAPAGHNLTGTAFGYNMWLTLVSNDGTVCAVTKTGSTGQDAAGTDAWLLSRVISAQKANTANGLSHDTGAISSGFLFSLVQPGPATGGLVSSLYGLQHSNPVDSSVAYKGSSVTFGTEADPLKNKRIGGVNAFGGGLAVYNGAGKKIGGIGVSGDTSCEDHSIAWAVRKNLKLDLAPTDDSLAAGVDHPDCNAAGLASVAGWK